MIIPLRLPNGLPDLGRLGEWAAVCDRCDDRRPIQKCSTWLVGRSTNAAVYCPPCAFALAAELIGQVSRCRLALVRLQTAVPRAIAALARKEVHQ
ncbi:hypothetical protein [Actinoallomurus sp. CA-150999]|uniref:hypothetical protein n=1 Tax=Actinoallomurus sp. CA-150999 TaxID=3239887 RepID=UPI003D9442D1